jgi:hypothetical protein
MKAASLLVNFKPCVKKEKAERSESDALDLRRIEVQSSAHLNHG